MKNPRKPIDISKVEQICLDVRRWIENIQDEHQLWQDDLCGSCGIASYLIWMQLNKLGYNPLLCFGAGHVFVLCQSYLIDVTASQFNEADEDGNSFNEIVIVKYKMSHRQFRFWNTKSGFVLNNKTILQCKPHFDNYGWPTNQRWDNESEIHTYISDYLESKGLKHVLGSKSLRNKSHKANSKC